MDNVPKHNTCVYILVYLPRLDVAVRPNAKADRVYGNYGLFSGGDVISASIDASTIAEMYSRM
jgi:hypothetical protein